jgi:Ribonuclease P/MRP, subunit p29
MSELLNLPQPPSAGISAASIAKQAPASSSVHPKLLKADFHGAFLTVKKARNPCLIGLQGIIIHETENAFKVVTEKDKVKRTSSRCYPNLFIVDILFSSPKTKFYIYLRGASVFHTTRFLQARRAVRHASPRNSGRTHPGADSTGIDEPSCTCSRSDGHQRTAPQL